MNKHISTVNMQKKQTMNKYAGKLTFPLTTEPCILLSELLRTGETEAFLGRLGVIWGDPSSEKEIVCINTRAYKINQ